METDSELIMAILELLRELNPDEARQFLAELAAAAKNKAQEKKEISDYGRKLQS